ncbi:hypothetical protein SAMN05661096_00721 [Marivirga sericea]|uniref:Uncharacterized protein n=1 Tax=Marivirga sericea TaxID=1028 RepID=A0A1X7IJQ6_9BACT|nr:glycosyltransferase [Marivirga sericea]SMG15034.1 hypothetical protein SAMN05661096_00721 [Marivirga sericea]
MKILLLGDFSGLGINLKNGLMNAGHEVTIASSSADWRNFSFDINLNHRKTGYKRVFYDRLKPFNLLSKLTGFDIIQLIDPFTFYLKYFPSKIFYKILFNNNGKSFLGASSMDSYFWKYSKEYMNYTPYEEMRKFDWNRFLDFKISQEAFDFNRFIAKQVDGIIPVMYDYEGGYRKEFSDKVKTVPLPLTIKEELVEKVKPYKKLVFFHGLNRYGFKGTRIITEAFSDMTKKYPNDLEFNISDKMPINEYLKVLDKTHVVVDQVNSYSYGMNALYSMAKGKIVMSGAEKEALSAIEVEECPVINIRPDKESIKAEIEKILDLKPTIFDLGIKSREFVEKYHDADKVALEYLSFWSKS